MRLRQLLEAWEHDTLGVSPSATPDEIRKAYLKRAVQTHPDKGGNEEEFKGVQNAWERLSGKKRPTQSWSSPQSQWDSAAWEADFNRRQAEYKAQWEREEEEYTKAFHRIMEQVAELLGDEYIVEREDKVYYIHPSLIYASLLGIEPKKKPDYFDRVATARHYHEYIDFSFKSSGETRRVDIAQADPREIAQLVEQNTNKLETLIKSFESLPWDMHHLVALAVMAQKGGFDVKAVHGFYAEQADDEWGSIGKHPFAGSHPRTWLIIDGLQVDYNYNIKYPKDDGRYRAQSIAEIDTEALDKVFADKLAKSRENEEKYG